MSKLRVAKVILPIALDKEFDYFIPENIKVYKGARVLIDFNRKKRVGIVTGQRPVSKIANLKPILELLDEIEVLGDEHIQFGNHLCKKYPYNLGEFLFMMLPSNLKNPKKLSHDADQPTGRLLEKENKHRVQSQPLFIKGDIFNQRYQLWREHIRVALKGGSVLICFPQIAYLEAARLQIERDFKGKVCVIHSSMSEKDILNAWKRSRNNCIILGTRVSIFYYPQDLNLIIVDEESSPYYFQEEKPFHNLTDVAFMLSKLKMADLILSGDFPSLSVYKLIKDEKVSLIDKDSHHKNIKVVEEQKHKTRHFLSPILTELLRKNIEDNERAVIIYNRKGFGAILACNACGHIYRCQHCSTFLKLSSDKQQAICPYCRSHRPLPKVCEKCNSGYLVSRGMGIERLGAVLRRMFPEAKIDNWAKRSKDSQIILATSGILSVLYGGQVFDRGFVLGIDSMLSRLDYEATFEAFTYLSRLALLFKKDLFVFTQNSNHYLFKAMGGEYQQFYDEELALRKELELPPYGVLAKITLREKDENRLFKHASQLYNKLCKKGFDVFGPLKEKPFKLRDKYRYTIIVKSKKDSNLREEIKEQIKGLRSTHLKVAAEIR